MINPELEAAAQKISMIVDAFLVDVEVAYRNSTSEAEHVALIGTAVQRLLNMAPANNRIELWRCVVRGIEQRFKDKRL